MLISFVIIVISVIGIVILVRKNNENEKKISEMEQTIYELKSENMENLSQENNIVKEESNVKNETSNTVNSNNISSNNFSQNNTNKNTTPTNTEQLIIKKEQLIGDWQPSIAKKNGENIGLQSVYGTSIKYGGTLTFKEDGTYTKFIGAYSSEMEESLQGTYTISETSIVLWANSAKKTILDYENGNIIEYIPESEIYVYYTK